MNILFFKVEIMIIDITEYILKLIKQTTTTEMSRSQDIPLLDN